MPSSRRTARARAPAASGTSTSYAGSARLGRRAARPQLRGQDVAPGAVDVVRRERDPARRVVEPGAEHAVAVDGGVRRLEQLGQQVELAHVSATGWLSSLADSDASTGASAREAARQSCGVGVAGGALGRDQPGERRPRRRRAAASGDATGGTAVPERRARPTGRRTPTGSPDRAAPRGARRGGRAPAPAAARGPGGRRARRRTPAAAPRSRSAAALRRASSGSTGAGRGAAGRVRACRRPAQQRRHRAAGEHRPAGRTGRGALRTPLEPTARRAASAGRARLGGRCARCPPQLQIGRSIP